MMTREEYFESLRKLNLKVYMFGELVENPVDNPIIRPSLNSIGMTYELANQPEYEDLMTATSSLNGQKVNRFTHLHQSTEDLVKKLKCYVCWVRRPDPVSRDVLVWMPTMRFSLLHMKLMRLMARTIMRILRNFLNDVQLKDLVVDGAMTDPKGDRSLSPSKQADPDSYLRVVERRPDGVVVRGAKAHQTGIVNSHEVLVMPTIAMKPDDKDYAISFAVPTDSEGIFMIYGRQSCDTRKDGRGCGH